MTSFAFILGVLPLVIGEGAGAEMRRSLGTAVFSGMIGVTAFGLILTPVFYTVIIGWTSRPPAAPALVPAAPADVHPKEKEDSVQSAEGITTRPNEAK